MTRLPIGNRSLGTSSSPIINQPSREPSEPGARPLSAVVLIDFSIAVDPIKYIGVPSSFNDFKPDGDIVDNDGVPGKPFSPVHSVLGPYSHVMPLSLLHGCIAIELRRKPSEQCLARATRSPAQPWHYSVNSEPAPRGLTSFTNAKFVESSRLNIDTIASYESP
jgi:hypothetical protein